MAITKVRIILRMIRAYVVILDVWDCYRLSVKCAQTIQGVISKNTDDP